MIEWKDVEADEFDETHCAGCRLRARLARALAAKKPQTTEETAAVVNDVVHALPLGDVSQFVLDTLADEISDRRRRRRRTPLTRAECH